MRNKTKFWTKSEIAQVVSLWEKATIEEIANQLDRKKNAVLYIAAHIRKCGYNLPKKHKVNTLDNLIKEVLSERNLI